MVQSTQPAPYDSSTPTPPSDLHWRDVYDQLETAIKVRHYSAKTLESYRAWTRQLHAYVQNRLPTGSVNKELHQVTDR
jgi:hypothetical protein